MGGEQGSGGVTSTGGSSETSAECDQLARDYDMELQNAKTCMATAKAGCSKLVQATLADCRSTCFAYVDDAKELDNIRKDWKEAGCAAVCTQVVVCSNPTGASCVVAAALKMGVCVGIPDGATL
jgi:hypothetical protein